MGLWWGVLWGVMGAAPSPLAAVVQRNPAAPPVHAAVEEGLRKTLAATGAYRVLPQADTHLGLETARAGQWQCDGAPACMSQLSNVVGAPVLVDVECSGAGTDGVMVVARLMEGKQEKRRAMAWLPNVTAQQQRGLQRLARALTAEHAQLWVGAPQGTPVCVDGECVNAQDPVTPWMGLTAGPHVLVVKAAGGGLERSVTTPAGQLTRVKVGQRGLLLDGEAEPAPPVATVLAPSRSPSRVPWGVAVSGGVLAVTSLVGALALTALGVASGTLSYVLNSTLHRRPDGRLVATGGQTLEELEAVRNRVVLSALLSAGALGVGALLLVTAVAGLAGMGGGLVWSVVAS